MTATTPPQLRFIATGGACDRASSTAGSTQRPLRWFASLRRSPGSRGSLREHAADALEVSLGDGEDVVAEVVVGFGCGDARQRYRAQCAFNLRTRSGEALVSTVSEPVPR